jgi:sugar phosphate isomerase/epimerase
MEYTSTVTIGGWRERLGSLSVRRAELDDKELVTRTLSGDLRSYEELVSRYERLVGRVVYPYARREISVEDLVQETFLRAWRTAVALAERLGTKVVHFPGDHGGFTTHPEPFAARLYELLAGG